MVVEDLLSDSKHALIQVEGRGGQISTFIPSIQIFDFYPIGRLSCGPLRASKHIRANVFPLAENKLEKLRSCYYAALT